MSSHRLSIRTGPTEPPLLTCTIPEHFSSIVSLHGDRPAIHAYPPTSSSSTSPQSTTLTYHALDLLSNRLAASLQSLNLTPGSPVAVSLGNTPAFAALTYAAFKIGAVLVPLNPAFNAQQVAAALRHLQCETLVTGAVTDLSYKPGRGRSNEVLLREVAGDMRGGKVESEAVPTLKNVVVVDNLADHPEVSFDLGSLKASVSYKDLVASSSDRPVTPSRPLNPSDTINIQFTSGTTSAPKAAMLSHSSILNNGRLIAHRMGLNPDDRIVVPPPLFHCFGCILGYMATATTGAAIGFPSPAFDPHATLRMCSEWDATGLYGVSTMLVAVLESLDSSSTPPPQDLKKGIVAGSSVPAALMRKVQSRLGLDDLVICYGMTETSPVSCMTTPNDPFSKRTTTVGTPMPHTTVKIVSPSNPEEIVPLNTRGELAASGYLTMAGYFNDPEKTAEVRRVDSDGRVWVYSGDEAEMDEDGFVQITGRIKDLIIRGGENIHPLEIENCLFQLEGVMEVSVVGVPDEKLGEAVAAFVVPRKGWVAESGKGDANAQILGSADVRTWVKEKLSSHLVPRDVFWVNEYPKTASGKIQKFKLREIAADLLKAGKGA
ncbi:AMP-binding enzyme domain-containing protein [Sarocladium implicatum]|nr:AMP-binding enzyme domain-containing protein [Sarocladium implicatum]